MQALGKLAAGGVKVKVKEHSSSSSCPDLETREEKAKRSSDVLLRPFFLMGGPMTFMTLELWDHGGHCSFRKTENGSRLCVSQLSAALQHD